LCATGRATCGRRMSKVSARSDDMLIIRGVNIYPQQIEETLLSIEGVAPHYQIVVSREGLLDELEIRVEISESIFFDQMWKQQEMKERIENELGHALMLHAKVRLVEPSSIPRSEGKAVRVLDQREKPG